MNEIMRSTFAVMPQERPGRLGVRESLVSSVTLAHLELLASLVYPATQEHLV